MKNLEIEGRKIDIQQGNTIVNQAQVAAQITSTAASMWGSIAEAMKLSSKESADMLKFLVEIYSKEHDTFVKGFSEKEGGKNVLSAWEEYIAGDKKTGAKPIAGIIGDLLLMHVSRGTGLNVNALRMQSLAISPNGWQAVMNWLYGGGMPTNNWVVSGTGYRMTPQGQQALESGDPEARALLTKLMSAAGTP